MRGFDQGPNVQRQCAFQSDDAEGCGGEIDRLGVGRVRRVVGGEDRDDAVGDALCEHVDVTLSTQGGFIFAWVS